MVFIFFFSIRRRHTRSLCDWSSDVCSSDLIDAMVPLLDARGVAPGRPFLIDPGPRIEADRIDDELIAFPPAGRIAVPCQVRICGKPPSIRPDLAPHTIPLHQLHHLVWKLDELELGGMADESARDPRRVGASE